jgi:hypothetical protein
MLKNPSIMMKTIALALAVIVTAGFSVPAGWSMCVTSLITGVCSCCAEVDGPGDDSPKSCCEKDEAPGGDIHAETGNCSCDISMPEDSRRAEVAQLSDIKVLAGPVPAMGSPAEYFAAESVQPAAPAGLRSPPITRPVLSLLCVMIC